ncbi:hypothetical protein F4780DRAFT_344984 [Xylariomycetidae sp. FL0641]|nr:hypothetical protein F4780DRAFT_344984 [Xylariomycetidae sp. FL0641]
MRVTYTTALCLAFPFVGALNIFERQSDVCKWNLEGDDCICMNSVNGAIMVGPTGTCCTDMGLGVKNLKCHVGHDDRDAFKECCKWLNIESCIGHCR